jgi:hypothetical protein
VKRPAATRRINWPGPPKGAKPSTIAARHGHTTVPLHGPAKKVKTPRPLPRVPTPTLRAPRTVAAPNRQIGRIIDEDESSLIDLIDNLLQKGVMLNADLILALANVDLVYIRLSALLCAADRVMPPRAGPSTPLRAGSSTRSGTG